MPLSLRIWRFTDGRPGHEKQTAGLLQGFRERLPVHAGEDAELAVRDIALVDYADDWSALWRDPADAPDLLIGARFASQCGRLGWRGRGGAGRRAKCKSAPLYRQSA